MQLVLCPATAERQLRLPRERIMSDKTLEGRDLLLGRSTGSAGGAQSGQEELLREILAAVRRSGDDPALAKDVQALLSAVNAIGESLSRSGRDAEELKSAVRELARLVEERSAAGADFRKAFEETVEAGRKRIRQEIDWSMSLHVAKVRGAVRGLFFGRVTAAVLAVSFLILTGVQLQHRFGFLKPDDPPFASLIVGTGIKCE